MLGHYMRIFIFCCFTFCALLSANEAMAKRGKLDRLTEDNVRAFIEETSHITSGHSRDLSNDDIKRYLKRHLEPKSRFKSVMKYHVAGMPPQENSISLSKEEFIKSVEAGAKSVDDYEHIVEIQDIRVSSDGKKAFVKTTTTEVGTMPVPTQDGGHQQVPVEGESECNQILSLNKGVIQMFSASCTTDLRFQNY